VPVNEHFYIGTSGYVYDHWKKVFYPESLLRNEWLEYYSRFFNTVELNVTFYNLPKVESFKKWNESTPTAFKFSVKGPRLITHYKKLLGTEDNLNQFYQRIAPLQEKIDVILWQFQPAWKLNLERLSLFLDMLKKYPGFRYAFEFRHKSWFDPEVYKLMSVANAAIVLCDWPFNVVGENQKEISEFPTKEKIVVPDTANFFYLRRHGTFSLYSSLYNKEELEKDAITLKSWADEGNVVYEYFNNDANGNAVKNAQKLQSLLNSAG
jgi:uncharacterized protein YecE (DUF72 family)